MTHAPLPGRSRPPLGSVVAGLDLSERATEVVERAARLPIGPGCSLTLLHVASGDLPDPTAEQWSKLLMNAARGRAESVLRSLGRTDIEVICATAHGTPFVEIIRRARSERSQLIVVGRHGRRSFPGALLGSTAERVFRKAEAAVLIVSQMPEGPYRRPLVAVDLSETSGRAAELGARLLGADVGAVDVLHARAADEDPAQARASVDAFLAKLPDAGVRWNVSLVPGDPRDAILTAAAARNVDLLVVGSHGRSGISHLLVGSIAEAVVRGATCDVLVARSEGQRFELP